MPIDDFDELFGVDPNEFVATRDRLARELRSAGEKEQAKELKQFRRPSVPIWALNQLARSDPATIHAVVDAAATAHQAQVDAMNGADPSALRGALAERRGAIERTIAEASAIIDASGRSRATYEHQLADTLNAVVSNEALAEVLENGRLVSVPHDNADVDIFAGMPEPVATRPREREREAEAERARERGHAIEDARQRLREAETTREEAVRAREHAQEAVDEADRNMQAARAALESLTQLSVSEPQDRER